MWPCALFHSRSLMLSYISAHPFRTKTVSLSGFNTAGWTSQKLFFFFLVCLAVQVTLTAIIETEPRLGRSSAEAASAKTCTSLFTKAYYVNSTRTLQSKLRVIPKWLALSVVMESKMRIWATKVASAQKQPHDWWHAKCQPNIIQLTDNRGIKSSFYSWLSLFTRTEIQHKVVY